MKSIFKIALPLFIILTAFSCVDNNEIKKEIEKESAKVTACYDETALADPWFKPKVNDSILISNITKFLVNDSLTVYKIAISLDGQREACKAGFCKTGRRIKALIDRTDLIKIQKIGFYELK